MRIKIIKKSQKNPTKKYIVYVQIFQIKSRFFQFLIQIPRVFLNFLIDHEPILNFLHRINGYSSNLRNLD